MIGWREAEAKLPLRIARAAYGCLIPARHGAGGGRERGGGAKSSVGGVRAWRPVAGKKGDRWHNTKTRSPAVLKATKELPVRKGGRPAPMLGYQIPPYLLRP